MHFTVAIASLSLVKRTLLHTFGPSYAALLNQEYAFSLYFAAYLVAVVAPNAGHVPGVVTIF